MRLKNGPSACLGTYSADEFEYADNLLGSEGVFGEEIPRGANGSASDRVNSDCRCTLKSRWLSIGVRGPIESVGDLVEDTDLDGGLLYCVAGGRTGEAGDEMAVRIGGGGS